MKTLQFLTASAAGLAMTFGMASVASAAAVPPDATIYASQSAEGSQQGDESGRWNKIPYVPNANFWWTKSVSPTPDGSFWNWGMFSYLKFDLSSISIPQGQTVGEATIIFQTRPNPDNDGSGYIDLYQITPDAADWDVNDGKDSSFKYGYDPSKTTVTWSKAGKYLGDKVGGTEKLTFSTTESQTISISLTPSFVQGWLDGSIANRGLEIWYRPISPTSTSGLNVYGANNANRTNGIAPKLEIHYVPEPASGSLLLLVGLVILGGRGVGSTRRA